MVLLPYNLRHHVTPQEGLLIIFDRSQAIKAAYKADDSLWKPPRAFHAYCIRHMAVNFMSRFKSAEGKRYLIMLHTVLAMLAIIRCMHRRLQQLFVWKGREVQAQMLASNRYSQWLQAVVEKNKEGIQKMRVTHCDRRALIFWSLHFSCCHALAACTAASFEWGPYVYPVYLQESELKVYEVVFPLIPDEKLWP
ncbi:hypothetical protein Ahy_A06g025968 [Arachis hypogaea]|uniref:MULE transposase domain-containing protein n=1 Tax=Arachis hypogaea TaxID=3818 RepID=A0A445CJ39_ARAHY|nr:hypothetical protein Ahy_A06g025968 [Arachis hypogaea]